MDKTIISKTPTTKIIQKDTNITVNIESSNLTPLDTTNFDNNLDSTVDTVQKLAQAVDDLVTGGTFAGTMDDITNGSTYVKTHNDFSDAEQSKLSGIAAGAEVNVNADWDAVSGDAQILNKPSIPSAYTLPTAEATVLGGVKIGDRLTIAAGVLSADVQSSGDMLLNTVQSVTAEKKFTKDKISMLGTSIGKNIISTVNASATDYTNILPAKDGTIAMTSDITGTNSGINTGDNSTNSNYSGLASSKQDALVSGTNIKTINSTSLLGSGDIAITGGGFWTLAPGTPTRTANTTFTMTGDQTAVFAKGLVIKWTESDTIKIGMVSIPSTYSAPATTVTIIGDTMASIDASSLKYGGVGASLFTVFFAVAGTIGAVLTDVSSAFYANCPYRVLGADIYVGTAGTTNNTTVDINKNGTTMFTTKPTLASTVAASPTPFTADSGTSLALNDKITLDIDAVQTTAAIDLYVRFYVFATRYLYLT
jgi:hypothetical protein